MCIGVDEILMEMKLLRAMLLPVTTVEMKTIEEPVNGLEKNDSETLVKNNLVEIENEKHIPVWDINDSDFDFFPELPNMMSKALHKSDMNNNAEKILTQIIAIAKEHTALFVFTTITIAAVVSLVLYFLAVFCCKKKTVEQEMVIEHPHLDQSSSNSGNATPLRSISEFNVEPVDNRSSMSSISLTGFLENPKDIPTPSGVMENPQEMPAPEIIRVRFAQNSKKYKTTVV